MDGFIPRVAQPTLLNLLDVVGGPFAALPAPPEIHLFQNNIVPSPNTVLADFTEANYVGYLMRAFTPLTGTARDSNTGEWHRDGGNIVIFTAGAIVGPQTLYGWYITDSNGNLFAAGRFDTPPTFALLGDSISLIYQFYSPAILIPDPYEP